MFDRRIHQSPPRRGRSVRPSLCHPLEPRRLFAAVDVGVAFDTAYGAGGLAVPDVAPGSGTQEYLVDAAVTPDGRALLVGSAAPAIAVARLTPSGERDASFGSGGVATFVANDFSTASDASLLPDGRLLVSGSATHHTGTSTPPQRGLVLRLTPDGRPDPAFGAAGADASGAAVPANSGVTFFPGSSRIDGLVVLPDGKILAGGHLSSAPGWSTALWRLHPDGTPDTTFGSNGVAAFPASGFLRPVLATADGTVLVLRDSGALRVNADGTPAGVFAHATGADRIRTLVAQPDGKVLLLRRRLVQQPSADGDPWHIDVVVERFLPGGAPDPSFGAGTGSVQIDWRRHDDEPADLHVQRDGRIVVGATSFRDATTANDFALARLLPGGALDPSFGRGGTLVHAMESPAAPGWGGYPDAARRLLPAPGGRLIVAGTSYVPPPGEPPPTGFSENFAAARYALDPGLRVDPGGPYGPVPEGQWFAASAAAAYANGPVTRFEWDDAYTGGLFTSDATGPLALLRARDDDPPPSVALRVTTSDGLRAEVPVAVTATNVAPTFSVTPDPAAAAGVSIGFFGPVYDPGFDYWDLAVDWGDGTAPYERDNIWLPLSASHAYAAPGDYTATFTVSDDDGGSATVAVSVHVADLAGVVYHDLGDDGAVTTAEPALDRRGDTPLAGCTVYLDLNDDGAPGAGEPATLTDERGVYRFDGLAPGPYTVRVIVPEGWRTSGASQNFRRVTTGTSTARSDFGLTQRSRITGLVYADQNGDGVRNPGEGWLQAAGPYADLDNDGRWDPGEPRGFQLEPGSNKYSIPNLDPGTYTLRYDVEDDPYRTVTQPAGGGAHVVTVGPAQVAGDHDFGVALTPSFLMGNVFHDADGDGMLDTEERRAHANTAGGYRLGVVPGAHSVRLLPRDGWAQTTPPAGHDVTVESGRTGMGLHFGARLTAPPAVVGRHVYYGGSAFERGAQGHPRAADAALAPDKRALLPGAAAIFANVSTYERGITGVLIDLRRAPQLSPVPGPHPADFTVHVGRGGDPSSWASGPAVKSVTTHWGEGAGGSDRVQIEFDAGALRDTWVRVTVAANERTGLAAPDVFYYGHLAGAVAGAGAPADLAVDARDLAAIRRRAASPPAGRAPLADPFDVNRDGTVDLFDVVVTRLNQRHTLSAFTAPAAPAPPAAAAARSPFAAPTRRTPTRRPADYLLAPPP